MLAASQAHQREAAVLEGRVALDQALCHYAAAGRQKCRFVEPQRPSADLDRAIELISQCQSPASSELAIHSAFVFGTRAQQLKSLSRLSQPSAVQQLLHAELLERVDVDAAVGQYQQALAQYPELIRVQLAAACYCLRSEKSRAQFAVELTRFADQFTSTSAWLDLCDAWREGHPITAAQLVACAADTERSEVAAQLLYYGMRLEASRGHAAEIAWRGNSNDELVTLTLLREARRDRAWTKMAEVYLHLARGSGHPLRSAYTVEAAAALVSAGLLDRAERTLAEFVDDPRHDFETLLMLRAVALERRDWAQLVDIDVHLSRVAQATENRAYYAASAVRTTQDHLDNREQLASLVDVALSVDPSGQDIADIAEQLFTEQSNWRALLALYREQAERIGSDNPRRNQLKRRYLRALIRELGDDQEAWDQLAQSIAAGESELVEDLLDQALRQQAWRFADKMLAELSRHSADADARLAWALQRVEILTSALSRADEALKVLQSIEQEHGRSIEVDQLTVHGLLETSQPRAAARRLSEMLEYEQPDIRLWAAAHLIELGVEYTQELAACYQLVVGLVIDNEGLFGQLRRLVRNPTSRESLAELFARRGTSARDHRQTVRCFRAAVTLLTEDLQKPHEALRLILRWRERGTANLEVTLLLGQVWESLGEQEQATAEYLAAATAAPELVDAYRGLVRTAEPVRAAVAAALVELIGFAGIEEAALLVRHQMRELPNGKCSTRLLRDLCEPLTQLHQSVADLAQVSQTMAQLLVPPVTKPLLGKLDRATLEHLAAAVGLQVETFETAELPVPLVYLSSPKVLVIEQERLFDLHDAARRFQLARWLVWAKLDLLPLNWLGTDASHQVVSASAGLATDKEVTLPTWAQRALKLIRASAEQELPRRAATAAQVEAILERAEFVSDALALALCGSPGIGLREVGARLNLSSDELAKHPYLRELIAFGLSDAYAQLDREVWLEA